MSNAQEIRYQTRVRELSRMTRGQLEAVEARVRHGRRIYGKPSKDEMITEIMLAEFGPRDRLEVTS